MSKLNLRVIFCNSHIIYSDKKSGKNVGISSEHMSSAGTSYQYIAQVRQLNEALEAARGEMLTRVQEAAESELRRYQAESEQMFNRSITALKIQMDEDRRKLQDLTTKNVGLTGDIGQLLQTVRTLESDVNTDPISCLH